MTLNAIKQAAVAVTSISIVAAFLHTGAVSAAVNDPGSASAWNLSGPLSTGGRYGVDAPAAWAQGARGQGVTVAVVDTGVNPNLDLVGRLLPGYDFVSTDPLMARDGDLADPDASDPGDGHSVLLRDTFDAACSTRSGRLASSSWRGTKMAGVIAASANNGVLTAGVAPEANILPVRVNGSCFTKMSDVRDGILWAAGAGTPQGAPRNRNPADIVFVAHSMWDPEIGCDTWMQSAVDDARAAGAIVVTTAGNGFSNSISEQTPASCRGVVRVVGTDDLGYRVQFSNVGTVEMPATIAAPGWNIPVIADQGTLDPTGNFVVDSEYDTTLAAAHVAGALAVLKSAGSTNPVRDMQLGASTPPPGPASTACTSVTCGAGLLNVAAALAFIDKDRNVGQPTVDPVELHQTKVQVQQVNSVTARVRWQEVPGNAANGYLIRVRFKDKTFERVAPGSPAVLKLMPGSAVLRIQARSAATGNWHTINDGTKLRLRFTPPVMSAKKVGKDRIRVRLDGSRAGKSNRAVFIYSIDGAQDQRRSVRTRGRKAVAFTVRVHQWVAISGEWGGASTYPMFYHLSDFL